MPAVSGRMRKMPDQTRLSSSKKRDRDVARRRRRCHVLRRQHIHPLLQGHCRWNGGEAATNLAGLARNGLEQHRAASHVNLETFRLPVRRAHLGTLEPEPSTLVKTAEKTETEIHIRLKASIETNQVFHARIDPQLSGYRMKDA